MFKKFFLSFFMAVCANVLAQENNIPVVGNQEGSSLNVIYRNDACGKIYANTRGYGFLYRRGKHLTGKIRSFYEFDLQGMKHPKEVKVSGSSENRKRFVYGKLNSVYFLRGNFGMQNVIFSKADLKAVEVRFSYSFGGLLAFAKPYYYQLPTYGPGADPVEVKFNSDSFTQDSVIGKGKFITGIAETKIYPGVNGKFNISFEYAPYTNLIRAIETGVSVDYFPVAVPIMARNPAEHLFITLHVGFVFGRKWY